MAYENYMWFPPQNNIQAYLCTQYLKHGDIWMAFLPSSSQAHLVAAFEKSLGNMTGRLQSLTMTAEQKVGLETADAVWKTVLGFC